MSYVYVKDAQLGSGYRYVIDEAVAKADPERYEITDTNGADREGRPLPPKYSVREDEPAPSTVKPTVGAANKAKEAK